MRSPYEERQLQYAARRIELGDKLVKDNPEIRDMIQEIWSDCRNISEYEEIIQLLDMQDFTEWFLLVAEMQNQYYWGSHTFTVIKHGTSNKERKMNTNEYRYTGIEKNDSIGSLGFKFDPISNFGGVPMDSVTITIPFGKNGITPQYLSSLKLGAKYKFVPVLADTESVMYFTKVQM